MWLGRSLLRRWSEGTCHIQLEPGFSRATGVPTRRQARTIRKLNLSWEFPRLQAFEARGSRLGRPQRFDGSLRRHQLEPGGPWRAWDQVQQGVPSHTDTATPLEIQPKRVDWITGRFKSNQGWLTMSAAITPKPRERIALLMPASPAYSSRKTCFLLTEMPASARLSTRRRRARTSGSVSQASAGAPEAAAARGGTRRPGSPRRCGRTPRSAAAPCGVLPKPVPPCRTA